MNKALFKATLRSNYKLFLIIFAVMIMYSAIVISMYDPNSMEAWEAMLSMFPDELLRAMNFNIIDPTLLGYIAGYYYGFIIVMFPMIYISIIGQRVIAQYVDNGSMSFLLATPNTRKKIVTTQALYMLLSTILLILSIAVLIYLFGLVMFPGQLDILPFVLLNANVIGLFVLLSSISFFASCLFNEVKLAVGFGAGLPIFFFVVNMLANINDELSILKYVTVFTWFDSSRILSLSPSIYLHMLLLYTIGFLFYLLGINVFNKKDLHI